MDCKYCKGEFRMYIDFMPPLGESESVNHEVNYCPKCGDELE